MGMLLQIGLRHTISSNVFTRKGLYFHGENRQHPLRTQLVDTAVITEDCVDPELPQKILQTVSGRDRIRIREIMRLDISLMSF